MHRRGLLFALLGVLAVVASGCGGSSKSSSLSTSTTAVGADPSSYDASSYSDGYDDSGYSQDDWDNQEGEAWDLFSEAYVAGWEEGCNFVYDESPDGNLYDQGEQFSVEDCIAAEPYDASEASDLPYDVPDDPEFDGNQLGQHDGCVAAFVDTTDDALFWGDDVALDESDCP